MKKKKRVTKKPSPTKPVAKKPERPQLPVNKKPTKAELAELREGNRAELVRYAKIVCQKWEEFRKLVRKTESELDYLTDELMFKITHYENGGVRKV